MMLFVGLAAWAAANPTLSHYAVAAAYFAVSALVTWAFKPRTDAGWSQLRPVPRQLLRVFCAVFVDAPKATDALTKLVAALFGKRGA